MCKKIEAICIEDEYADEDDPCPPYIQIFLDKEGKTEDIFVGPFVHYYKEFENKSLLLFLTLSEFFAQWAQDNHDYEEEKWGEGGPMFEDILIHELKKGKNVKIL